jgi:hypothetical protein
LLNKKVHVIKPEVDRLLPLVSAAAHKLRSEINLLASLRLIDDQEVEKVATMVSVDLARIPYGDEQQCQKFLAWSQELQTVLAGVREDYFGVRMALVELEEFIITNGITEDKADKLRHRLAKFMRQTDARNWLEGVKKCNAVQIAHAEFMARLKPATDKLPAPATQDPADLTDTERRVQLLEQAASKSSCWRARKYYRDGMAATDNREKLRLFKLSVREDERKRRSNT